MPCYPFYRKWGKILCAKLLHLLQFSTVPLKFFRKYLFILYKLSIMALFKFFKRKASRMFSHEKLYVWNLRKFSPANLSHLRYFWMHSLPMNALYISIVDL